MKKLLGSILLLFAVSAYSMEKSSMSASTDPSILKQPIDWQTPYEYSELAQRSAAVIAQHLDNDSIITKFCKLPYELRCLIARVWNQRNKSRLITQQPLHSYSIPQDSKFITYSPDGTLYVTLCNNLKANIHDIKGTLLHSFAHKHFNGIIESVTFSPDSRFLLTTSRDFTACLWDLHNITSSDPVKIFNHNNWVRKAAFSPMGDFILTAADDRKVYLWNIADNQTPLQIFTHMKDISFLGYLDNNTIITTSSKEIFIWDKDNNRVPLKVFRHDHLVKAIQYSPDGHSLIAGVGNSIVVWDINNDRKPKTVCQMSARVRSITCSHNGKLLAMILGADGSIPVLAVVDLATQTLLYSVPLDSLPYVAGKVQFSLDDCSVAVLVNTLVKVLDMQTGVINLFDKDALTSVTFGTACEPKQLVTFSKKGNASLWLLDSTNIVKTFADMLAWNKQLCKKS